MVIIMTTIMISYIIIIIIIAIIVIIIIRLRAGGLRGPRPDGLAHGPPATHEVRGKSLRPISLLTLPLLTLLDSNFPGNSLRT